jgi:hypothetical protein
MAADSATVMAEGLQLLRESLDVARQWQRKTLVTAHEVRVELEMLADCLPRWSIALALVRAEHPNVAAKMREAGQLVLCDVGDATFRRRRFDERYTPLLDADTGTDAAHALHELECAHADWARLHELILLLHASTEAYKLARRNLLDALALGMHHMELLGMFDNYLRRDTWLPPDCHMAEYIMATRGTNQAGGATAAIVGADEMQSTRRAAGAAASILGTRQQEQRRARCGNNTRRQAAAASTTGTASAGASDKIAAAIRAGAATLPPSPQPPTTATTTMGKRKQTHQRRRLLQPGQQVILDTLNAYVDMVRDHKATATACIERLDRVILTCVKRIDAMRRCENNNEPIAVLERHVGDQMQIRYLTHALTCAMTHAQDLYTHLHEMRTHRTEFDWDAYYEFYYYYTHIASLYGATGSLVSAIVSEARRKPLIMQICRETVAEIKAEMLVAAAT